MIDVEKELGELVKGLKENPSFRLAGDVEERFKEVLSNASR